MAKGTGNTRSVNSRNASSSRTFTRVTESTQQLPQGWQYDTMSKSIFNTNLKISDEAKYAINQIYGGKISFGAGPNGDAINASSLQLAKTVAEHGKNLTYMFNGYKAAKTEEARKNYEKEINLYIEKAKKNK